MHVLAFRRRLSLQPLDRVQDPVPRFGAETGASTRARYTWRPSSQISMAE
jgi:hypothetical protein